MSPVPAQFADRWRENRSRPSYEDAVCWHLLLAGHAGAQAAAADARKRLARFSGLHMTPPQWLHVTVLRAGIVGRITEDDMKQMIARARAALAQAPPVTVTLRQVLYHPEAIAIRVTPTSSLAPVLAAAHAATRGIHGADADGGGHEEAWMPHLTICYSTTEQPAAPVIEALGKTLPAREVTIREMSLVVQQGPEPLWNWRIAGSASLLGSDPDNRTLRP
jgi:2'-5' RNA ligase